MQHEVRNDDHDRIIRLETTVEHLSEDVLKLSETVDKHIEEDRNTYPVDGWYWFDTREDAVAYLNYTE